MKDYGPVRSVPEFLERVLAVSRQWTDGGEAEEGLWYRGVCDARLDLVPGAYWRQTCDEESLFLSFRAMAPPYLPHEPRDGWEWYYLMQHYGLPTRLLDWTERPLVALYFAITLPDGECLTASDRTPCVWILDPVALNELTTLQRSYVFVPGDEEEMSWWLPPLCGRGNSVKQFEGSDSFKDNAMPVAIFPKRNNPRIVAQLGVFTVHGMAEASLEDIFAEVTQPERRRLIRIEIDAAQCRDLLEQLHTLRVDHSALFPEPASVAKDLKRFYKVG